MGHAVFKSNFGEKSPEYTNFLYDYAALQAEQASYDAALQNAEKTKTLRTQLFGENHPTTAQSIWLIAFINKKRGNFAAAIVAYQKAIQVITIYFLLAKILSGLTLYEDCRKFLRPE
jgi:cytochrome c-type biogenesis protein CcmH/NrfG